MANHDWGSREVNLSPFKTIHQNLSRPQTKNALSETPFKTSHQQNTSEGLLSGPSAKSGKNEPNLTSFKTIGSQSEKMASSFIDHGWWFPKVDSFQDPCKKSQKTQPQVYGPCYWGESSNFRSSDSKDGITSEWLALELSTIKRIEIQPHLHGAQIYIHQQYLGSSSIVPQQLQLHRWHFRRVWHQDRPYSPSSPTRKMESSHRVQGEDWKRAGRDGVSRNHHQTDWAHTMGQLSHIAQEGKWQVEDMPWPKGLE